MIILAALDGFAMKKFTMIINEIYKSSGAVGILIEILAVLDAFAIKKVTSIIKEIWTRARPNCI